MKAIKLSFIFSIIFSLGAFAQAKAVKKVILSTPTVQCGMCKDKIEKGLARIDGVNTVKVDYKKKITTISYVTDRTNEEALKTHIANLGYDAGDVLALESAYKKLPACCKKPDADSKMEH
jgi:copper chaperone CopZ